MPIRFMGRNGIRGGGNRGQIVAEEGICEAYKVEVQKGLSVV